MQDMKSKRFFSVRRVLILIVAGLIVLWITSRSQETVLVEVINPEQQSLAITLSVSGEVAANHSADMGFNTTGKLIALSVAEGEAVRAGQVLAAVDSRQASESLNNAVIARNKAIAVADEITETYGEDITWGIGFYKLRQAQQAIEQAETQIAVYQSQLGYTQVTSPFDGIVLDTNKQPGEIIKITDTQPVVKIVDLASLYFTAQVDEEDIGLIQKGQKVNITLDAYEDKGYPGSVALIKRFTTTDPTGSKVIEVEISFDDRSNMPDIIGLSGDAEIMLENIPTSLTIPLESVQYDNGHPYVYLVVKNTVHQQNVELGKDNDELVQIIQGLEPDDIIVFDSNAPLEEGTSIKIR